MKYLIDTHILVWYFTKSPKLDANFIKILDNSQNEFVIPIIVLAEIKFLHSKKRIIIDYEQFINLIFEMNNVVIYNIDLNVIEKMPLNLNIHDALIVGTGLVLKETYNEKITLLTMDKEILESELI